jgi:Na+:H+ antiporter, NhaA family
MAQTGVTRLDPPVDPSRDHILGDPNAEMVLVEYGSYACPSCREANVVIARLREHFGSRLCYVFRHRPISDDESARRAAVLAEYAAATDDFWPVHGALMTCGPVLEPQELDVIAKAFDQPSPDSAEGDRREAAEQRVREDERSAAASGASVAPSASPRRGRHPTCARSMRRRRWCSAPKHGTTATCRAKDPRDARSTCSIRFIRDWNHRLRDCCT